VETTDFLESFSTTCYDEIKSDIQIIKVSEYHSIKDKSGNVCGINSSK